MAWPPSAPVVPELPELHAKLVFESNNSAPVLAAGPVAVTDHERAQGLMFRRERLGDAEAMLFVMDQDDDHGFWMKNTFIPLDMIFVDAAGTVVGVAARVQPHTTTSNSVGKASRYVVEVDAGWCERHGIQAGWTVHIEIGVQAG